MFKWLAKQFTQADEDPDSLGSEKGIEAFLGALPVTVPARTVEALGEQFENARGLELAPEPMRRALKRLDERGQEPLRTLASSLFEDSHGRKISDSAWLTLARYYRNVHTGYQVCLDALAARPAGAEDDRGDTLLIGCRAMAALGRYKALLRLRYRDVDPGYWEKMHRLSAWGAQFGGGSTLMELYPDSGYQSSLEREYLIALLLEVAPIANLLPTQMAALDLILRRFAAHYQFSDSYRESTPFVLDPLRNQAPQRWLKGLAPRPGQRFFGIGGAYPQLGGLRKSANASAEIPEWLAPANLDIASYRGLLELLVMHWSVEPPQRRHRRDRGEGDILVTHGVAQVRRMIAASEYAKAGGQLSYQENTPYDHKLFGKLRFGSVEERPDTPPAQGDGRPQTPMEILQKFELEGDRQMTERWVVADLSESGLGAMAQSHGGWARVGMLVGFRRMDSLDWQMAIVRRLSRSTQGRLSVGLQTVRGATWCARLRFGGGDGGNPWVAVAGTSDIFHDAVLLRADTPPTLLVDQGIFVAPGEAHLSFEKRWHKVHLERAIERGYDYEQIELSFPAGEPATH